MTAFTIVVMLYCCLHICGNAVFLHIYGNAMSVFTINGNVV